jgi:hypothetical protein
MSRSRDEHRSSFGTIRLNPKFGYLKRNLGGVIELGVESPINSIIRLEAATDFGSWTESLRATNLTGVLQFEDKSTGGLPFRFYRASDVQE